MPPEQVVVSYPAFLAYYPVGRVTGGTLKDDIHPKYVESKVTCSCGETFTTRSTLAEIKVEVCSACHPFYTGKQKLVDTAGRVERFNKKYRRAEQSK
jgi:large subunit ribosomal protein L31